MFLVPYLIETVLSICFGINLHLHNDWIRSSYVTIHVETPLHFPCSSLLHSLSQYWVSNRVCLWRNSSHAPFSAARPITVWREHSTRKWAYHMNDVSSLYFCTYPYLDPLCAIIGLNLFASWALIDWYPIRKLNCSVAALLANHSTEFGVCQNTGWRTKNRAVIWQKWQSGVYCYGVE